MTFLLSFTNGSSDASAGERPGFLNVLGALFSDGGKKRMSPPCEGVDPQLTLMEQIAGFVIGNRLAVTARNLAIAHAAFSGLDPKLRRKIEMAMETGDPVTQQWLDGVATSEEKDGNDAVVEELVEKLDHSLAEFSRNTRRARQHTRRYSKELEQQIDELERGDGAERVMDDLTGLTRAMLERSRKAEAELKKRERESAALERSLEKARRAAEIDHLTGLPNRRAFEAVLERSHRETLAAGEPLCVAFCDLDHFKSVNDAHGHDAGDRVLKATAEMFAALTSDRCHAARHGGEEFVMLFAGTTLAEASELLDGVREKMARRRFVNRKTDEPFGQITFSAGVADVFAYDNARAALVAADEALYRAKEAGRNRVLSA